MGKHSVFARLAAVAAMLALAGCQSGREGNYGTLMGWQAEQCKRFANPDQIERCQAGSRLSYKDYKAERDGLLGLKAD